MGPHGGLVDNTSKCRTGRRA